MDSVGFLFVVEDIFMNTRHLSEIMLQLVVGLALFCHKMLVLYSIVQEPSNQLFTPSSFIVLRVHLDTKATVAMSNSLNQNE